MLLTLGTTHAPATDLGYLLHKNPARVQTFPMTFGAAHVFYPQADAEHCSAALMIEVDPIALVRDRQGPPGRRFLLESYVNDRPYVASSFMSVAIAEVFGTALSGRCKDRPELVEAAIPLTARISVLPCRGGESLLRELFEPLGYTIRASRLPLDETVPDWGDSVYFDVQLEATLRLQDLLAHLYVLIPVLDDDKHYWVGDEEVDKLLRHGQRWLASHPSKELITHRYLKHQQRYARAALEQLVDEQPGDPDEQAVAQDAEEAVVEERVSLNQQRMGAVLAALKASGARRVLDLGCGEGRLIRAMLDDKQFEQIVGVDVSHRMLEIAGEKLRLDRMPPTQRDRIKLLHGSLVYRDERLTGFDAAAVVEVIEHLDPPRLAALERVLFECAKPTTVVVTTPNVEYNVKWETLPAGKMRHRDHRFEWTRAEFQAWATPVAERFGYTARFLPVGPVDEAAGSPTQMAVFSR